MAPWMLALKLTELNPGGCTKQMSNRQCKPRRRIQKKVYFIETTAARCIKFINTIQVDV
jgi:hypothetical protein